MKTHRKLTAPAVEDYPRGYPRLSAFQSSDGTFAIFRKFGTLHARSLLLAQAELLSLESQLNAIDVEERVQLFLSSHRHDNNQRRLSLLQIIKTKLEAYGACRVKEQCRSRYQPADGEAHRCGDLEILPAFHLGCSPRSRYRELPTLDG